ncbi:hypothetical protein DL546_008419 [Coniochaeta pulveracea]|uniref:Uncharacterized protein n=1 Tax=Coniochaeta pulveracea TaxID=177199 RepID=A0A420YCQ2_9PEZI|nr:hypothetical protein DL546_008419 [Coniochaeta pulveracea]
MLALEMKLELVRRLSMAFDMDDKPLQQLRTAELAENERCPKMLIDDPGLDVLITDYSAVGSRNI